MFHLVFINPLNALLLIGPRLPIQITDRYVSGVSTNLAIIQFIVPRIAFIPELYRVEYNIIIGDNVGPINTMLSDVIVGSSDISSVNVCYTEVLSNLDSDRLYNFTIASSNDNFSTSVYSSPLVFSARTTGECLSVGWNIVVAIGYLLLLL